MENSDSELPEDEPKILSGDDGEGDAVLRDILSRLVPSRREFRAQIADADEMYHNTVAKSIPSRIASRLKYYDSGLRSFIVLDQLVTYISKGLKENAKLLEFACGHGRLTRFLVPQDGMSDVAVTATDIYSDAVEFQKDYFESESFLSVKNPEDFQAPGKFDIVLAMSVFTHWPDHLFKLWLARLFDCVSDDGILCFTVRSSYTNIGARQWGEMPDSGILFVEKSESDSLPFEIYGLTIVTDEYVQAVIEETLGTSFSVKVFRKAMYENQDLYVVARNPERTLQDLTINSAPLCGVGNGIKSNGTLKLFGWAIDLNPNGKIVRADIFNGKKHLCEVQRNKGDDELVAALPGTSADASIRLRVDVPETDIDFDDTICVEVENNFGKINRAYLFKEKVTKQ